MRFLDPKEEVIKIKITPYGKYLLSQGRFNPSYYAFYDDDIIYDYSYAGNSGEEQNEIEDRILNKTPRFAGQTKFEGAEATVFMTNPNMIEQLFPGAKKKLNDPSSNFVHLEEPVSQYYLKNPIGKNDYNTDKAPYFNLQTLTSGNITNVTLLGTTGSGYYSEKEIPTTFIPQIEAQAFDTITLDLNKDTVLNPSDLKVDDMEFFDSYYVFEDGTKLIYDKEKTLFKLEEGNTVFQKDNFEIEVFVMTTTTKTIDGEEVTNTQVEKMSFNDSESEVDQTNVEYYFDIKCDNEIEPTYFCETTKDNPNKTKDIFSDNTFICPDKQEELEVLNIYNTNELEDTDGTGNC